MRSLPVLLFAAVTLLAACSEAPPPSAPAATAPPVVVYKSPTCGCCTKWMDHANANGLATELKSAPDMDAVQDRLGVPRGLRACHVATVGDYLIVGHVPAEDIKRLLAEKPKARGIAVAGMPLGSPGMEHGDHRQPYDTVLFQADGTSTVFTHHGK